MATAGQNLFDAVVSGGVTTGGVTWGNLGARRQLLWEIAAATCCSFAGDIDTASTTVPDGRTAAEALRSVVRDLDAIEG